MRVAGVTVWVRVLGVPVPAGWLPSRLVDWMARRELARRRSARPPI